MLKLPHGVNTVTNNSNGTMPNQEFEIFLTKINVPNPFFKKTPNQVNLENFLQNLRKRMKRLLKTYLGDDFAVIELEIWWIFEWKIVWDWERHEESTTRETRECLKICHISPLKLKTCVFRFAKLLAKNASEAQNLLREVYSHETVAKVSI